MHLVELVGGPLDGLHLTIDQVKPLRRLVPEQLTTTYMLDPRTPVEPTMPMVEQWWDPEPYQRRRTGLPIRMHYRPPTKETP